MLIGCLYIMPPQTQGWLVRYGPGENLVVGYVFWHFAVQQPAVRKRDASWAPLAIVKCLMSYQSELAVQCRSCELSTSPLARFW